MKRNKDDANDDLLIFKMVFYFLEYKTAVHFTWSFTDKFPRINHALPFQPHC